jgi:hypothetical protein
MGERCIEPVFFDLGTSWRWVVSFTPRPLYPRGKSPRYPLDRRLGGPQGRSRRLEKRIFLTLPGLELRPHGRPARSQSLYQLHYPGCRGNYVSVEILLRVIFISVLNNESRSGITGGNFQILYVHTFVCVRVHNPEIPVKIVSVGINI